MVGVSLTRACKGSLRSCSPIVGITHTVSMANRRPVRGTDSADNRIRRYLPLKWSSTLLVKTKFNSRSDILAFKSGKRSGARTKKTVKPNRGQLKNSSGDFASYAKRNAILKSIGYKSYAEYLRSGAWKIIRARHLGSRQCKVCVSRQASVLHHVSYSKQVLLHGDEHLLVPLCHRCHGHIETLGGRGKATLEQANLELIRLWKMPLNQRFPF